MRTIGVCRTELEEVVIMLERLRVYLTVFPDVRRIVDICEQGLTKVVYVEYTFLRFPPVGVVTIAVDTNVFEPCFGRKPFFWPKLSRVLRSAPCLARTSS